VSPAQSGSSEIKVDSRAKNGPYLGCTIDDRYLVEAVLGEGGMGVVYRCRHKIIGKKVAMKVLRADMARDAEVTERFLNEARSASAIGNPHIIDISDFGQLPDASTYFVMEYLDGIPLADVVEEGKPVPVPRILNIARQLCEGLAAAHNAGIVHRDLKPDNIYLIPRGNEKDFVKILDFGIAKVSTSGEGKLTRAGAVFGTPHYMAPEQAAGAPVDHRGDIYSLGVILYELASGRVPFDADNFMGILTQHMYKSPVPIRALVPEPQDVPPGLEAIVLKCLSKRAEQRYQSMEELLVEVDKLRQGVIPDAVPEMMARSGGFNVPADYFKKGGTMPAPMPATPVGVPAVKSRWPLYAGLAGVIAAVAIVVAIFAKSSASDASPNVVTESAPVGPAHNSVKTAPVVEPSTESLVVMRQVMLAVEPLDARVFRDGTDLGNSPLLLEIEEGKKVALKIVRKGYETQTIEVDGSEGRRSVKLEREAAAAPRRASTRSSRPAAKEDKTKTKPKSGLGGEIVDPWQ
jgi:serine/threonine-protein kinase